MARPPTRTNPAVSGLFSVIAVNTRTPARGGEREAIHTRLRSENEIGV
jgi:hypothetical protein